MEKILTHSNDIIQENEKIIANILHDVKSPLYSIKIGLQSKLDNELNKDIFETTVGLINYIENFLINYNFKSGKYESIISQCDLKQLIKDKLTCYKFIFLNKNINIDFLLHDNDYIINSINVFLSSILGNIISNMAIHGSINNIALIEMMKKNNEILIIFKNRYENNNVNFNLGLSFSKDLAKRINAELKMTKTSQEVRVQLKIPAL